MNLLSKIYNPSDLKRLKPEQLDTLCAEIRTFLIDTISQTGGHLASNLGVVELTVALHKVFDSPIDKFVWDVGHQCYVHKILTGRLNRMNTLRQKNGISGFPKPMESIHDSFISGHSSTSISVAYGIAKAKKIKGEPGKVVAIIGDGALTGGLAFEALNNAGRDHLDNLIIVLNDNKMSISKNVGSLSKHLATLRNDPKYFKAKDSVQDFLNKIPLVGKPTKDLISAVKSTAKGALYGSNFFEDLGLQFMGPVNGHSIQEISDVLQRAKKLDRPVLVYVNTVKGKGYPFAEENPGAYHGISCFDVESGNPDLQVDDSYSRAMGLELTKMAKDDSRICAVTAAMKYGTELQHFAKKYRDRFFDVGIAEEHAVTFCAALAHEGMKPLFAVYSSFLQRAYDQLIHDVAISGEHVVFAVDRAGIVGQDGETHQGLFDVSFLSTVPGMTIFSPSSYSDVRKCLHSAFYEFNGPVAIRYPKGNFCEDTLDDQQYTKDEEWNIVAPGEKDVLLVSYGRFYDTLSNAAKILEEQHNMTIDVLKLIKIHPLDIDLCKQIGMYKKIIFFEECVSVGSIGQQLIEKLNQLNTGTKVIHRCFEGFIPQASVGEVMKEHHFDEDGMLETILKEMNHE